MASEQPTNAVLEEKSAAAADGPTPNSHNFLEGVPDLSTYVATDPDERTAALKLIADSVAQQRAFASQILIFHPALIGLWILFTAVFVQYKYKTLGDLPLIVTTMSGVTMSCFVAVRYATGRYIFMAEEVNWKWLGDDDLVVSKYGDQVIGALALAWDGKEDKKGRKMKGGYGLVRAWTVRLKYRGKSIGQSLLEEAVEETVRRGGEGIEFAEDHLCKPEAKLPMILLTMILQTPRGYYGNNLTADSTRETQERRRRCNTSSRRKALLQRRDS